MFKSKRSQAALEFLTTYAWAFIAISITLGALYYFDVFNFSKYAPQKCTFTSQFDCLDFSLTSTRVKIKLANNLGETVKITSAQITNDANPPISCSSIGEFDWVYSSEKDLDFTCSGGGYLSGERVELKVTMNYYSLATNVPIAQKLHTVNGKINGRVSS